MNARTIIRNITLFSALLMALFLGSVTSVLAQEPSPPDHPQFNFPSSPGHGPQQTADGHWYMPANGSDPVTSSTADVPQETGGPDDYGYTWDNSLSPSWIDASGGFDTGINNDVDHAGPIDIGFPFKFYEHTYGQLYISRSGYVTFHDDNFTRWPSRIPSPRAPNDVIAPYWMPIDKVNGYIRYLRGGETPNRWFTVEWNHIVSISDEYEAVYTFEVVIHENGDIDFQYQEMLWVRPK
jgi:hypothetical protein